MKNRKQSRTDGLLNPEQHLVCRHYRTDVKSSFSYYEFAPNDTFPTSDVKNNRILFIRTGAISIDCGKYKNKKVSAGSIVLLPSFMYSQIVIEEESKILICSFEIPRNHCDNLMIDKISGMISPDKYDFGPIRIKDTMGMYVDLLIRYVQDKINCEHLQECKEKELFSVFKCYYTDEELAQLFHNLSTEFYEFKVRVFKNYKRQLGTQEMADVLNMSRRKFEMIFKDAFGDTYANWMLKHISNKLIYEATKPGASINNLMECGDFNSLTTLNRTCKKCFGCTPGKLLENKGVV